VNWSVPFVVLTLFAVLWWFVTAVAVGLEEGRASRELKRSMYVALVVAVVAGLAAAILTYLR
jgi:hypothetical protein